MSDLGQHKDVLQAENNYCQGSASLSILALDLAPDTTIICLLSHGLSPTTETHSELEDLLQENQLTVYIPIDLEVPYNHLCKEKNLVIIPQVGVGKVVETSSDETTFTETEYFSIDNTLLNELDGLPPTDYMSLLH